MATLAAAPNTVAVWAVDQRCLDDLTALRDYQPAADANPNAFLLTCRELAGCLLSHANLKDQYESNAGEVLCLHARQAEDTELLDALQILLDDKTAVLARAERILDFYQSSTAAPAAATPASQSVKIPDPPMFSKGRAEYRVFRTKLEEKLLGDAHHFRNAAHQLSYAMGFLAEEAYEISHPLRASGDIGSVEALLKHLDATYEDPDRKGTTERELCALHQGNSDFTSYYAKFQSILAVLGWVGDAKRSVLTQSLSQEIKQVLSTTLPSPDETFDKFFAKVKPLDDQIRRYAAEFKGNKTPQAPSAKPRPPRSHSNNPVDSTGATPHTGSAPMDLSAQRRIEAHQAQYMKWAAEGKCMKYGSGTHWRSDCPRHRPLDGAATDIAASSTMCTPFVTAPATPTSTGAEGPGKA